MGNEDRRFLQSGGKPIEASVTVLDGVRVALIWAMSLCLGLRFLLASISANVGREKRPRLSSGQLASR